MITRIGNFEMEDQADLQADALKATPQEPTMNVAVQPTDTAIIPLVDANPVLVLIEPEKFEPFYEAIKAKVMAHVPDTASKKGRDAIRSLASDVTKTKTAIDAAGKKLNEAARAQINVVDASRRNVWARLEALADDVRKPLTDWEEAEKARIAHCKAMLQYIEDCGRGMIGGAQQPFAVLFHELEEKVVIDSSFGEFEGEAHKVKAAALDRLKAAFEAEQKATAEREELERLRAEKAERDRAESERIAKEAAERRAREEAAAAEARRVAAEQAEKDRIAAAEKRAGEAAKAEAERAHQEEITRLNREAAAAETARKAEADRITREEAAKAAEAKRIADEDTRRAADKAHRSEVMAAAKVAIMEFGEVDEAAAKRIVLALVGNSIPHVTLKF